jgi:hypothetical protein
MTRWQVTVTNGRKVLSKASPFFGEAAASAFGLTWAKALTVKGGDRWRFVSAEQVDEGAA